MATCKDCFRFEVFDSGRHIGEYEIDDGVYTEGVENECLTFKPTADVVEVVRCKDCKFRKIMSDGKTYACLKQMAYRKPDDFCSYGERRGDEQ